MQYTIRKLKKIFKRFLDYTKRNVLFIANQKNAADNQNTLKIYLFKYII